MKATGVREQAGRDHSSLEDVLIRALQVWKKYSSPIAVFFKAPPRSILHAILIIPDHSALAGCGEGQEGLPDWRQS